MSSFENMTTNYIPPDFYASGDRGRFLVATSASMIGLTSVAVTLRFVSRWISKKVTFWWDDWCALISWVLLMPMFCLIIDSTYHGVGRHQGTLSVAQKERLQLDIYIGEIFYNFGLTATKFSALFFYMRVFPWTHMWFRICIWIGFALCIGWSIAITFMGSFQCTPPSKYWKGETMEGKCLSTFAVNIGTSIPNVVIDTFILLIPMPFIKNLQVTMKQKIGVAVVFFAGYATLALSLTRVAVTAELRGDKLTDYSWNSLTFLEVVDLEPGIGLISVCLPAQVYLFRFLLTEIFGLSLSDMASSLMTSRNNLKKKSKRSSDRVKSMIERTKWRNLSNSTSNTSYSAEVFADLVASTSNATEGMQGIQVQTDVTVRPSSWAPQFVALILG